MSKLLVKPVFYANIKGKSFLRYYNILIRNMEEEICNKVWFTIFEVWKSKKRNLWMKPFNLRIANNYSMI